MSSLFLKILKCTKLIVFNKFSKTLQTTDQLEPAKKRKGSSQECQDLNLVPEAGEASGTADLCIDRESHSRFQIVVL